MEKAGICRYFQKGNCKLKGNCPYLHKKEQRAPCKFFAQGYCKFGNNCNFYHAPKRAEKEPFDLDEREVRKPREEKREVPKEVVQQEKQEVESDVNRMQKINTINALLGVTKVQKDVKKQSQPTEVKADKQKAEEPIVNYARKILVSFVDLSKTPEGKENTERINREIYQKPYMEYLKELTDPLLKQQAPIMRRYQYSFKVLSEDANMFSLKLSPIVDNKEMKLNFDIPERCLELTGNLHPKNLEIVNKSIPEYFRQELNWQFQALLKTRSVYDTLKYLENYFEKVCEQVDFILENKRFNEKDLQFQFDGGCEDMDSEEEKEVERPRPVIKKPPVAQEVPKPTAAEDSGDVQFQKYRDEVVKREQSKEEQKNGIANEPKEQEIVPEIELTSVLSVQTLETNCESLLAEELLVHLQCFCSAMITYIVKAKRRRSLILMSRIKCSKCKEIITIYIKRHIMLRNSNGRVAEMGCINAKIEDVGAVLWKVNCICENVIINDQLSLSGVKKIVKCFDCFREYFVQYYGIFVDRPELLQQERQRPKMEKQKETGGTRFKLDTELPSKGTCQHYKFSFRWLRFACCGRAFPCDRCHEANTEKHDYDRADVMICGMCSYEQPYDSVCRRCKKELVKGTEKSGHWEGGKGCRDQKLLSRNDPKKYTGQNKTVPNKK